MMSYEIRYDIKSDEAVQKACDDVLKYVGKNTYNKLVKLCKTVDRSGEDIIRMGFVFAGVQGYPVDAMMKTYPFTGTPQELSKTGDNSTMWDKTKSIKRIPFALAAIVEHAVATEVDTDNLEGYVINNPAKEDWTIELNKSNVSVTLTMIDDDNDLGEERLIDEEFILEALPEGKYRFSSLDN